MSATLAELIRQARASLLPMGVCHACGDPLRQANGVFCDDVCGAAFVEDRQNEGAPE